MTKSMLGDMTSIKKKTSFSRSRVYPRYSLEQAILFCKLIDTLGGKDVLQQSVMAEMSKKSPNDPIFTGKVSSAKQFGLLEVGKKGYSITERAKLLLYPTDETDERKLLVDALEMPDLYGELISRFNGKELPVKVSLGNLLFNQFGIAKNAKNRAAGVFIKSAEFARTIVDGYLRVDSKDSKESSDQPQDELSTVGVKSTGLIDLKLPVTGGDIRIIAPKSIKDVEVDNVAMTIKAFNNSEDWSGKNKPGSEGR